MRITKRGHRKKTNSYYLSFKLLLQRSSSPIIGQPPHPGGGHPALLPHPILGRVGRPYDVTEVGPTRLGRELAPVRVARPCAFECHLLEK